MFRKFRSALVRGLVVVLPIGFTIWLLWWIGSTTESLLRRLILLVVPPEHYLPGMGIAVALVLLLAAGTLFNALIVQSALATWERFLDRIPVVKTIYGATRDFMKLLPTGGKRRDLRRVVLARFGEARVIGFVTQDDASELGIVEPKRRPRRGVLPDELPDRRLHGARCRARASSRSTSRSRRRCAWS